MYKTLREEGGGGGEESRVAAMPVSMLPRAGLTAAICIDKVHICKARFVTGAHCISLFSGTGPSSSIGSDGNSGTFLGSCNS